MDSALLTSLRFAGPAVLVVSVWVMWMRRITFGSRIDLSTTVAVGLFGLGSALDSPWHVIATFSHPVTGRFYGLTLLAGLCYTAGAALVVGAVYRRLLPDDELKVFMRRWVIPFSLIAAFSLAACFMLSGATSQMSAVHLRLVRPDVWLSAYWISLAVMSTVTGLVASYGVNRLREDPRSVFLSPTMWSLSSAVATGGVVLGGSAAGYSGWPVLTAWLLTYFAFMIAAVVSAFQWWNRRRRLFDRGGEDLVEEPVRPVEGLGEGSGAFFSRGPLWFLSRTL